MKFFLALVLLSTLVAMTIADQDEDMWNFFKSSFGRKHSAKNEAKKRANFIKRHKFMEKHNRENKGWVMGHNKFSDMSDEEVKTAFGAKTVPREERTFEAYFPIQERAIPASIDYRTDSCLQPVKDQGGCGSCWTFASVTPLEFNQCKKSGTPVALSEQMLVDCDTNSYNAGCNGGMYTYAWKFLQARGGAMKASAYPYTSGSTEVAGTCKFSSTGVAAKVSTFNWIVKNTTAIAQALQAYGPLPSAIKVLPSFMSYAGGIFQDTACTNLVEGDIDHAITIVGYGTDAATATNYWIVRNSWSTAWGEKGYFRIKRGVNMCNIEAWTAYVTVA